MFEWKWIGNVQDKHVKWVWDVILRKFGILLKNWNSAYFLHQKKYAKDTLKKFKMSNFNQTNTPTKTNIKLKKDSNDELVDNTLCKHIIGSLRYLCNTRLDFCHNVGLVRRFMKKPRLCHLLAPKRILRFIRDTNDYGVIMSNQQNTRMKSKVFGYSESHLSGDQDDRKNTYGHLFMLINNNLMEFKEVRNYGFVFMWDRVCYNLPCCMSNTLVRDVA